MTSPKRLATSLIETPLTSTASISQATNFSESSRVEQRTGALVHADRLSLRKTSYIGEQLELTTAIDKNKQTISNASSANEDDWVCPVAVALRRAGYNVPLRPSKSWLERDRKKQALLREQQRLSKEM